MLDQEHQSKLKYYQKQYKRQLKVFQQMLAIEMESVDDEMFIPSQAIQTEFMNLARTGERLIALTELLGR